VDPEHDTTPPFVPLSTDRSRLDPSTHKHDPLVLRIQWFELSEKRPDMQTAVPYNLGQSLPDINLRQLGIVLQRLLSLVCRCYTWFSCRIICFRRVSPRFRCRLIYLGQVVSLQPLPILSHHAYPAYCLETRQWTLVYGAILTTIKGALSTSRGMCNFEIVPGKSRL
jgi:hypothetical protein